ncbi:S-layer homology domain-containing protein [Paenibacillus farraposensis]|uniref:S-layer homology domain-containing protein n=1 Tax=Paenibacillus farraposensis TaxID=2807095 RepID=A0ABW4D8V4_9BACL|nr:S-layer homology domain-containing protein [Paenibacillus farraposensis]MCC3381553.1 S-layer homology domain-containing protein [Paenibacillus farraposensis]
MKKWVNIFTAGMLATSIWASPILAADSSHHATKEDSSTTSQPYGDMANHWATDNVTKWSHRGVVSGVENARFEPNRPITRSEWAALLNRAFQIQPGQAVSFTDVNKDDWFAPTVTDAVYAGYMKGFEDGSFRPTQGLSREEAAVTVNQLLQIPSSDTNKTFKDSASLHNWSQKAVNAVVAAGIIEGYQNGTFQPKKSLTRAEAVTILDRAVDHFGAWYGESGTYGPSTGLAKQAGNVVINTTGITLQNTEIAGDLIIGKAVGKGDVFLKNVKVHGQTYVYGGGENGLHLNNSVLVSIIVNNVDGTVRLVAEGATSISEIKIKTGAALDVSQGASVNRVTLTNELPTKSNVSLTGYFHTVNVEAFATNVNIPNGQIDMLNVADNAKGTTIDIAKESSILSLVLHAAAKVIGLGSVDKAIVNAENVSFQTKPKTVTNGGKVSSNVKVTIGNSTNTLGSQGTTSSGGGGGSSSNSNESDKSKNKDKKDNTPQTRENNSGDFEISVPKKVVAVGEAVYFTSSRDGVAYFSNNIDIGSITSLELGVESGKVQKIEVEANKTVSFSTYAINNYEYPRNFEFNLTVYDKNNNYVNEGITVFDENKTIVENPIFLHYPAWENELDKFSFNYNRLITVNKGKTTNNIVQWAIGDGPFLPFTEKDGEVEVKDNKIIVSTKSLEDRVKYKFQIVADAVVTRNGEANKEYYTTEFRKTVRITMIQPSGEAFNVKKGGDITFSLSDVAKVYLINTFDWESQSIVWESDFNDLVAENRGKKRIVTDDEVNKPVTISTGELPPGNYTLYVWDGQILELEIIE